MDIIEKFTFRNMSGCDYPDLVNYTFTFNLSIIDTTILVIEDMGTGKLWVKVMRTLYVLLEVILIYYLLP